MAQKSFPTTAEAITAAEQIYLRRTRCMPEDPDLERFPDTTELLAIVSYASKYRRVPKTVLRADVADQLIILGFLRSELDRRQLVVARTGRRLGDTWKDLAVPLRVNSAQAAEQTVLRLSHALEGGGPKDERKARGERKRIKAAQAAASEAIRAFVGVLRQHQADLPAGSGDELDELVGTVIRRAVDESTAARARMLCDDLDDVDVAAVRVAVADLRKALPRRTTPV